jgi:hypothetical protein
MEATVEEMEATLTMTPAITVYLVLPYHPSRNQLREEHGPTQICRNDAVEALCRHVHDVVAHKRTHSGVIDENVNTTVFLHGVVKQALMVILFGDVSPHVRPRNFILFKIIHDRGVFG